MGRAYGIDRDRHMKTGLEAVLQAMISGGWANESDGDVDSPVGHYARITNTPAEMHEVSLAFADVMSTYECESDALVGYWLVVEDSQGNVSVTSFDNEYLLTAAYMDIDDAYSMWLNA